MRNCVNRNFTNCESYENCESQFAIVAKIANFYFLIFIWTNQLEFWQNDHREDSIAIRNFAIIEIFAIHFKTLGQSAKLDVQNSTNSNGNILMRNLTAQRVQMVTLMLMTDVVDDMCWWRLWDIGDDFAHPVPTSSIIFSIPCTYQVGVVHQYSKDVTNNSLVIKVDGPSLIGSD